MTDLVAELDRLHGEVVEGKCEMGLNLDYCTKHARRKKPGLGSCGPRKRSLMKYAAEMQEAWPEVSKQLAAVERVREICADHWDYQVRREAKFGRAGSSCVCEICDVMRALDVTP